MRNAVMKGKITSNEHTLLDDCSTSPFSVSLLSWRYCRSRKMNQIILYSKAVTISRLLIFKPCTTSLSRSFAMRYRHQKRIPFMPKSFDRVAFVESKTRKFVVLFRDVIIRDSAKYWRHQFKAHGITFLLLHNSSCERHSPLKFLGYSGHAWCFFFVCNTFHLSCQILNPVKGH